MLSFTNLQKEKFKGVNSGEGAKEWVPLKLHQTDAVCQGRSCLLQWGKAFLKQTGFLNHDLSVFIYWTNCSF